MGLLALLSVSPALRLATGRPRRYRTQEGQGLPRFGAEPLNAAQKKAMRMEVQKEPETRGQETGTSAMHGQARLVPHPILVGGARQGPTWWNLKAWLADRWFGQRNRFAVAPKQAGRPPVQQELSLENLKPCRNDLSDAGWELAPSAAAKPRISVLKRRDPGEVGHAEGRSQTRRELTGTRI
jgi:hypothetical protein